MKKVYVFFTLCLVLLISGCSVGDSGKNDWRQEIVAIYGASLVLDRDASEDKFGGHRYTIIFDELLAIRNSNRKLRMRAYSINTAGMSENDKQCVASLRDALDNFDTAICAQRLMYQNHQDHDYSSDDTLKQTYQTSRSNYIAQRNKVKEYISPTPNNTSSNKSK